MAIEQPAYRVLLKEAAYEVRQYDPLILAVSQEEDLRGYSGFGNVFDYIQGNNAQHQKIAMTAPVINELSDRAMTTAFVMPKTLGMTDLPQPTSQRLALQEKPARMVAVLRFSGNVKPAVIAEKARLLQAWITQHGYLPVGSNEVARYNPPFIPGVLKRNEVWLEVLPPQ